MLAENMMNSDIDLETKDIDEDVLALFNNDKTLMSKIISRFAKNSVLDESKRLMDYIRTQKIN